MQVGRTERREFRRFWVPELALLGPACDQYSEVAESDKSTAKTPVELIGSPNSRSGETGHSSGRWIASFTRKPAGINRKQPAGKTAGC